jgi:porin
MSWKGKYMHPQFAATRVFAWVVDRQSWGATHAPTPSSQVRHYAWSWGTWYALLCLLGFAVMLAPSSSRAQPVKVPPTWGGTFGDRPRLTGSWGGLRDEMGKKGVVLDVDMLLTPQAVFSGGRDTDSAFWGTADYTLNVDTGKLGLWPGGYLKLVGESSFGETVLRDSGALVPVNTSALMPKIDEPASALMNAALTQFLSPKFGLFLGKIFTFDGFAGPFNGNWRTQFWNTGLVIPMAYDLVPISAYGGGVIVLPWKGALLSAMALDPSGTPTNNDLSDAFEDGVMVLVSGKVTIKPLGLVGHQILSGMWSNKNRVSLIQDPSNLVRFLLTERFPRLANPGPLLRQILERFAPELLVPVRPLNHEASTWVISYAFDQYLWQPTGDPERGIGIFFSFGAADDKTNPVQYSYSLGIGGNGVVPGRPHDTFGIGWSRAQFSDHFLSALRQRFDLGLDHEDGIEMYYNAALTAWLQISLDLQIINPGLKKTRSTNDTLRDVNTAVVGGVRTYIRF